jgi:hypothetical protein
MKTTNSGGSTNDTSNAVDPIIQDTSNTQIKDKTPSDGSYVSPECQIQTVFQIRRKLRDLTDAVLGTSNNPSSTPLHPTCQSLIYHLRSPLAMQHLEKYTFVSIQNSQSVVNSSSLKNGYKTAAGQLKSAQNLDRFSAMLATEYPLVNDRLLKSENPHIASIYLHFPRRRIVKSMPPPRNNRMIDNGRNDGYHPSLVTLISDTLYRQRRFVERIQRRYFSEEAFDRVAMFTGKLWKNGVKSTEKGLQVLLGPLFGNNNSSKTN